MLELIAKYAVAKGLTTSPGFKSKTVKWLIELDSSGRFLGVQELGNTTEKKNQGLEFPVCPELPGNEMKVGGKAHPLVETLNVVVLLSSAPADGATEQEFKKHIYFVSLLDELAPTLPEAGVASASLGNEEVLASMRFALTEKRAKVTDSATLAVAGQILLEDVRAVDWWNLRRKSNIKDNSAGQVRCLVSGVSTTALSTHPDIRGLGAVGGRPAGALLISFDKAAFRSYGLLQSANAAVADIAATQYSAGLNHLIAHGKRLGPIIVGHWFSRAIPLEDDPFDLLFEGDDDKVEGAAANQRLKRLLASIETGVLTDLANFRFYVVTVSGADARVMIRDWSEGPLSQLVQNVNRWFSDLSIITSDGSRLIHAPKFNAIAAKAFREPRNSNRLGEDSLSIGNKAKVSDQNLKNLEAPTTVALWKAAFSGSKIPLSAMRGALYRTRIDILENQIRPVRMALLKAYIVRNTEHGIHMQPYLNENHPRTAYHAGRLMAVLALIQRKALGDVNANVVQRFYPSASSTPALVFARLVRLSQFHLNRISRDSRESERHKLENMMADIWGRISEDLPKTFSLEDQTVFALGYYQQIATLNYFNY